MTFGLSFKGKYSPFYIGVAEIIEIVLFKSEVSQEQKFWRVGHGNDWPLTTDDRLGP